MASAVLRDELSCSICTVIYKDPVTLRCGHSFCRLCITRTWDHQEERESSCPECRQIFITKPFLKGDLTLNNIAESFCSAYPEKEEAGIHCTYCVHNIVLAAKTCLLCEASMCENHLRVHSKSAEHVLTEPTTSLENRKCSVHKKVLEYYCCEDTTCICVSCRLDGEHRGHQVETLNEASEKKKQNLRNVLLKVMSNREKTNEAIQSFQEHNREIHEKATDVAALMNESLKALEKRVLSEISRQEEQVSRRVSDLIRQLEIKKEELSRKMGDIEQLCDMTDPLTVLQGRDSDRDDYCDTEEDTETRDIKVHDAGDLDVGLISVTLHSGLHEVAFVVRRKQNIEQDSDIEPQQTRSSDT